MSHKYDNDDEDEDGDDDTDDVSDDDDDDVDNDGDDGDGDDDDDDDDDADDDISNMKEKTKRETDVKEGLTIFIRNLSFKSSQESVATVFKQFGRILYCKIVVDPFTELSRGTAFVKYQDKESVANCLNVGQEKEDSAGESDELSLLIVSYFSVEGSCYW